MSYKHFNDIQSLYESVCEIKDEDRKLTEEVTTIVCTSMFSEGYTTTAIRTYLENSSSDEIVETYARYTEDFSFIDESNLTESVDDEILYEYVLDQESIESLNQVISEALPALLRKAIAPAARIAGRKVRNVLPAFSKASKKVKELGAVKKVGGGVKEVGKWTGGANPSGKPKVTIGTGASKVKDTVKTKVGNAVDTLKKASKTPIKSAKNTLAKVGNWIKNNKVKTAGGVLGVSALALSGGGDKNTNNTTTTPKDTTPKDTTPKSKTPDTGDVGKAAAKAAGKTAGVATAGAATASAAPKVKKPSTASGKELPKAKEVKKGSTRERMINKNIERHGKDAVDKLRSKNAAFHAARKKGTGYSMDDFVKDFPNSNTAKERAKRNKVTSVMDMESYDAFDMVSAYLIDSNQVENMDEALYVMTEMDAQTIQGIVEDFKKKA
tara:strand:+ start:1899 stop:3215 length:1317 start_codon:yes stop_codon:yes gene_type:complete